MNRLTKRMLEQELFDYQDTRKYIEEMKADIIESTASGDMGMPRGSGTSDMTGDKAVKIMSTRALIECTRRIQAVEKVLTLYRKDSEMEKLIDLYYMKRTHTAQGVAEELKMDLSTFYRRKNELLKILGTELGWIR